MLTCPRCHTAELAEKDRRGVKIDICPSCRGVWLDRGELEKLIAIAVSDNADNADEPLAPAAPAPNRQYRRADSDDDDDRYRRRKRQSWWDIFD